MNYFNKLFNNNHQGHTPQYASPKQDAFTLIELMIAIAVTSIILVAVVNLFISNTLSYNLQQSIVSIQEEGRYASQTLSQRIMLAGFSETRPSLSGLRFKGAEGADLISVIRKEADATGNNSNEEQYSRNGAGASIRFDQLVLQIDGGMNCAGNENWPTITQGSQWIYFYVNDKFQLMCSDSANNHEIVTSGVEAFQVQYGVDTDNAGEAGFLQPNNYIASPPAAGQPRR